MSTMSSKRPYLLRAMYEWIVDNDCTPYVVINATVATVDVPREFVKDDQIVLNVSPSAVTDLEIADTSIAFRARFAGKSMTIYSPIAAVMGVYARENGQGIMFDIEELPEPDPPGVKKPTLKVVK